VKNDLEIKEPELTYNPSKADKKVLDYVRDRIYDMNLTRQNHNLETDWDKWTKQCEPSEAERGTDLHIKNPSKIKKSLTREAVFGILAMTVSRNNEVQLIMQSENDNKLAPVFQKLSDHLSYVSKETVIKLKNYLTTIMLGTGVRKRIYRCDTRKIKEIISYDPETENIEYKETTVKDYDDADLIDVDPRMFYWDERATSHDDMRYCAERKIVPYSSFLAEYPIEKYPNSKYVQAGSWIWGTQDEKRQEPIFTNIGQNDVEVWEFWHKVKDMRVLIANGVLLQNIPIPYRHKQLPYTISVFQTRDAKRLDGIGIPELVEHDQALLDTLLNLTVDWMKLMLNKPILESSGDEMEGEGDVIELEAGKRITVSDVNNFKFFDIPNIDQSIFEGIDKVEQNAKKKVGVDDPMFGVKTGGTATENAIAAQATKQKIDLFFKLLEEDVDVRDEWLKLNIIQQFYSQPEKMNPILGEDGKQMMDENNQPMMEPQYRSLPIGLKQGENEFGETEFSEKMGAYFTLSPEALGVKDDKFAQFTVRVASRSTLPISKELRQQKWNEFLKTINSIPEFVQLADWKKLWQKTGEINEFDAEEFSAEPIEDNLTKLAEEENSRMMNGENIPATQGSNEQHTAIHIALADSTDFDQLSPEIQQVIVKHAQGEVAEQRMNEGQQTLQAAQNMNMQKNMDNEKFNQQMALKGAPQATPSVAQTASAGVPVNIGKGV